MNLPDVFQFIYHQIPHVVYTAQRLDNEYIRVSWDDHPLHHIKAGDTLYAESRVSEMIHDGVWIMTNSIYIDEDLDLDLTSIL